MSYFKISKNKGVGFGFMYLSAIVSVNFYFEKYRSLAMGIAVCGSGVGTFAFTPINRYLMREYGWRGGFLIKAAVILNGCVLGMLIRPVPIEPAQIRKQKKILKKKNPKLQLENSLDKKAQIKLFIKENIMDWELVTDFVFLVFAISNFLTSLGFNAPYIFIIDQAEKAGIETHHADWFLSIIGISNVVGRIFFGILSNLKSVNRLYLYIAILIICGVTTTVEPFFTSYTGFVLYSIAFGLTSGKNNI